MNESPTQPPRSYDHIQRHWISLVVRVVWPVMVTILLWAGVIGSFWASSETPLGAPLGLALLVLSLVAIGVAVMISYDWRNDYLAITRDSIIHYEQHYIFSHRSQAVPLPKVQNVGIHIPNSVSKWLDVGRILIDTASQEGVITFSPIKDPHDIQRHIFELLGRPVPDSLAPEPSTRFQRWLPINPIQTARGGLIWHRHWWVLTRRLAGSLAINLGLVVVFLAWPVIGTIVSIDLGLEAIGELVVLVIWAGSLLWIWYVYEDWKNDYWIVTDTHIIDVDALPLISEERRQARLEDIQDVRAEVTGLFDRFIKKGNVFAETAGKAQNFELREVMNPQSIQKEIFNRRAQARALAQQGQIAAQQAERQEIAEQAARLVMERMGWESPPAAK